MKIFLVMRTVARRGSLCLLMALIAACGRGVTAQDIGRGAGYPDEVSLSIAGYNYTNRYIDSFTVNGNGGGNLYVSSPSGGGGGTTCCVPYIRGYKLKSVLVRWQSGACYFHKHSSTSDVVYDVLHPFFKEQEVEVSAQIPAHPEYIEVHFYPDGSVRAALTETASPPRLLLNPEREDKSNFPRCANDRKPAQ